MMEDPLSLETEVETPATITCLSVSNELVLTPPPSKKQKLQDSSDVVTILEPDVSEEDNSAPEIITPCSPDSTAIPSDSGGDPVSSYVFDDLICKFCNDSSISFSTPDLLTEHVVSNHQRQYQSLVRLIVMDVIRDCPKCGKSFPTKTDLKLHTPDVCASLQQAKGVTTVSSLVECTICQLNLETLPKLNAHNALKHIEKYFAAFQPPDISDAVFQQNCNNILTSEVDQFKGIRKSGGRVHFECGYCFYQFANDGLARIHMLNRHWNQLLLKLLSSANLAKLKESQITAKMSVTVPNYGERLQRTDPLKCPECPAEFTKPHFVLYHRARTHPEQFLMPHKPESMTVPVFQHYCFRLLNGEMASLKLADSTMIDRKERRKCLYCDRRFFDLKFHQAELHLLTVHQYLMVKKLEKMWQNGSGNTVITGPVIIKPPQVGVRKKYLLVRKKIPSATVTKPSNGSVVQIEDDPDIEIIP